MTINNIVVAQGCFLEKDVTLLISFDENNKVMDIININHTKVGIRTRAVVEKVLDDLDACILKLPDISEKGFISNKGLDKNYFIKSHSQKKLVCQADEFFVLITQDRKGNKPYTCEFINGSDEIAGSDVIDFYYRSYAKNNVRFISDVKDVCDKHEYIEYYNDKEISLWELYSFTSILEKHLSNKVFLQDDSNIVIDYTEAMTVIDVNRSHSKKSNFEINKIALNSTFNELRSRNISGIVIVDLLKPMNDNEKNHLLDIAKQLSLEDYSDIGVHGFTSLGLLELTRSKIYSPIIEIF